MSEFGLQGEIDQQETRSLPLVISFILFIHLFTHLISNHLLRTQYVPGTILSAWHIAVGEKFMKLLLKWRRGHAQWFTPKIPVLLEGKVDRLPEVRNSRPAWLTWQNPVSTKNTKN